MLSKVKRLAAAFMAMLMLSTMLNGIALADGPSKLQRGDSGAAVEELQKLLKKHNCFNYDEITGYYGNATETGVRNFQAKYGLTVDGVAGAETLQKLKQSPDKDKPLNPDSLAKGMSGDKVKEIQKKLKDLGLYNEPKLTGYFGTKTEAAVKLFQQSVGMKADGVVGKKTRSAMFASFSTTSLVPGMKSDAVLALQKRMQKLGYYKGPLTGMYGQITQDAVELFQKVNGLEVDGIAGKATRAAVMSKNARTAQEARRKPKTASKPRFVDLPAQSAKGQEKGEAIVNFAKQFIGVPYVYGADGPNSFDCTGLTCYVYKNFGVLLPRSAKNQGYADYGIKITDASKLMPGDLIFFKHSNGIIGHAGIFVGDGQYIHAPFTGAHVRIDKLSKRNNFAFGRRVFK